MKNLMLYRYWLEMLAVPMFAFLVIHLSGHGLMLLSDSEHVHEGHDVETEVSFGISSFLTVEVLGGILALIFFVWVWHRGFMKKFVPCSHDHCHHKTVWPHLLAALAFVFHFFPESEIRSEMMRDFDFHSLLSLSGLLGFFSHFLVDLIIAILLSSFWPKTWQKVSFFLALSACWILAFYWAESEIFHLEGLAEPVVLLLSAFLLSMFVHKPHKPKPVCTHCSD
jgi:hypothetical protein